MYGLRPQVFFSDTPAEDSEEGVGGVTVEVTGTGTQDILGRSAGASGAFTC